MKKSWVIVFFAMLVLAVSLPAHSQDRRPEPGDKSDPVTKLELTLSKKGQLQMKEYYEIGGVSGQEGQYLWVKALNVREPGNEAEKTGGLIIEVHEAEPLDEVHSSVIDRDEIEPLSKAIGQMLTLAEDLKASHGEYTEVTYTTKAGFKAGFYHEGDQFQAFAQSALAQCFFPVESLALLKSVIEEGLSKLTPNKATPTSVPDKEKL